MFFQSFVFLQLLRKSSILEKNIFGLFRSKFNSLSNEFLTNIDRVKWHYGEGFELILSTVYIILLKSIEK